MFTDLSYTLTKSLDKSEKKNNGIYFTPSKTVANNLKLLEPYMKNVNTVLEPSCGSCEYIIQLRDQYKDINITGIEYNKTIFDSIKGLEQDTIKLYHSSFLTYEFTSGYDLIIGNPPYYVMSKKEVDKKYHEYFDGRPNIFLLFIIISFRLLNKDGLLSFVLPKNFLNCLYYDKTRKHIYKHFQIIQIVDCNDSYIETQQDTIILILRKIDITQINNESYSMILGEYTMFSLPEYIQSLTELCKDSTTLKEMGFVVNVGTVVWNQCKQQLTEDTSKTLLIYSSDIREGNVVPQKYSNPAKKNYIEKEGMTEPLLVINRGYGMGAYTFTYSIINKTGNREYLVENHLICIRYTKKISKKSLLAKYKKIVNSFENSKTKEFIRLYFGNNAINTTEMCSIMPIYLE